MRPKHTYEIHRLTPAQLFQFFQLASSLLRLTCAAINVSQARPVPGSFTVRTAPYLRVGQRLGEHPFFYIRIDYDAGPGKIRILPEHAAKLFNGAVILPCVVQNRAIVGGNDERKWIQLARSFALA